ncbi:MAG: hypothetical protein AAGC60_02735 [Acidobacteriota bacterium]
MRFRGIAAWTMLCLAGAVLASATGAAEPYEEPPTLGASDLLPADLLAGERHAIDPEVPTDGFVAYFTIHSDYGTFKAASLEEVHRRVHEIYAIAALDEMSRTEVAGNALIEGAKQPFLAAQNVLTQPGETLSNLGEGLGRWFERGKLSLYNARRKAGETIDEVQERARDRREERRQSRAAEELAEQEIRARALKEGDDPDEAVEAYRRRREAEASDEAEQARLAKRQEQLDWASDRLEQAATKYIGYDRARRRLAQELAVDPYSTNLELQRRLDAVAWSVWVGQIGSGYAVPSTELFGYVEDVNDLVWTRHPKDLEVLNRERLEALGAEREVIDAFMDNGSFTATARTTMVAALTSRSDLAHRSHFFRLAAAAESARSAAYFRRCAMMLERFEGGLDRLIERSEKILAAIDSEGDAVLFLPVDHLAWTESLDLVAASVERHRQAVGFEGEIVVFLAGDLTARARRELGKPGWRIETWGLDRLLEPEANEDGSR